MKLIYKIKFLVNFALIMIYAIGVLCIGLFVSRDWHLCCGILYGIFVQKVNIWYNNLTWTDLTKNN